MGKILSEKERKLQRKLIPLNIFVCILALVAAFSLMFAPILNIDFGKILRSEEMKGFVDKSVDDAINGSTEGEGGENGGSASALDSVDFMPVVAAVVSNVLGSAEGSVTFSAYNASKVAFSSGDDKANKVMDELFFGENALVTKLIDSIADSIVGMFDTPEGKQLIEETVVTAITTSLVANLSGEAAEMLTEENVTALTTTFKKFENVEDREGAEAATDEFLDELETILGDNFDREADGEVVKEYVMNMYDDTAEHSEEFSLEAMISVAVSKNVDLNDINIGDMFGGEGQPEQQPDGNTTKKAVANEVEGTEEPTTPGGSDGGNEEPTTPGGSDGGNEEPTTPGGNDGGNEEPTTPGGSDGGNEEPTTPGGNDSGNEEPNPPAGDNTDEDRVICTSYSELLAEMGLNQDEIDGLKANLKTTLQNMVNETTGEFSGYFGYYGYLFYGMLAFIVPWLILFLFSFLHMFAKNKRFTMWYVKLFGWIPGLLAVAFIVAPKIITRFSPEFLEGEMGPVIKAMSGGISSLMWISGICYVLLWLVSIFWAFPIKHKIRKERKLAKQYGGNYPGGDYPNGGTSDGKKNKKEKKNKKSKKEGVYNNGSYGGDRYENNNYNGYGNNQYGGNGYGNNYYGNNQYGNNSYGNNPYGGNQYGNNPYGGNYYGGNQYGSPYGGSSYDYDKDGFDSPYTGNYYGSYLDDDDI